MPEGVKSVLMLHFRKIVRTLIAVFSVLLLFPVSLYNYLLFHTIAEFFSIIIAFAIFIFSLNTRSFADNRYLLFLGIGFFFVGIIDFAHTLFYQGMNIVPGYGPNIPTQLWIGARFFEAISFVLAPVFFTRKLRYRLVLSLYLLGALILFSSIFVWPVFPDCYIDGIGLTSFKIAAEYAIVVMLAVAWIVLYARRRQLERYVYLLISISLVLTVFSEICFTLYVSTYGISNTAGHLLKILSYYLVYRAVIVSTLHFPYENLFSRLMASEKSKARYIEKLEKALDEINTLRGIIPICSYCKKIRNDRGAWEIMESYISSHSEAQFSHGVCPECYEKMKKDLKK